MLKSCDPSESRRFTASATSCADSVPTAFKNCTSGFDAPGGRLPGKASSLHCWMKLAIRDRASGPRRAAPSFSIHSEKKSF
jgi:hypothetical protein